MLFIILATVGAFVSAIVAAGKNRSAVGWAALGFFFPVIGMVAILCLPAAKSLEHELA